jgi:hypothetical protein
MVTMPIQIHNADIVTVDVAIAAVVCCFAGCCRV